MAAEFVDVERRLEIGTVRDGFVLKVNRQRVAGIPAGAIDQLRNERFLQNDREKPIF
jgi:hypothetical protein